MSFPHAEIEAKLDYAFKDKRLLEEAFTHSTYAHRYRVKSNERMEYLGDSVLQLVVTEWQYKRDKNASEGTLTAKRQKLVCKDALDSAIDGLGVWQYLRAIGTQHNLQGKAKSSLFEAIVAAIYLDGGYRAAKKFILQYGNVHSDVRVDNPKGELKEYLESLGAGEPRYKVEKTGKDNAPLFHCVASALGQSAKGEGRTKKEAEATAAARLLWELQGKNN